MPSIAPIECDVVEASDGRTIRTVRLSVVPRIGEEIELDLGGEPGGGQYRIVRVRYHVRPRAVVRTDDLLGISLFVEAAI
jgi:hypothetical protein